MYLNNVSNFYVYLIISNVGSYIINVGAYEFGYFLTDKIKKKQQK